MEASFLTRDQALSLWRQSTDSKSLDYQRTNPREDQTVRAPKKKPLEYKTYHRPTTSSTLCMISHLNNKTKIQTYSSADRITTSLSLAHQRKNKTKLSKNLTLYEAYINQWTRHRRAENKRNKEFNLKAWEKEVSNTIS